MEDYGWGGSSSIDFALPRWCARCGAKNQSGSGSLSAVFPMEILLYSSVYSGAVLPLYRQSLGIPMSRSIVVVGSVNLDLVCTGKRIPAPGETVTGERFERFHGGKGANQAVAVARLGHPVSMVAKVGADEFGTRLRQGLRSEDVNVRAVTSVNDVSSGVAL
ncbi:MAG: PfkB family carbohydrate kinase, partial [Bryocella sp.]